MDNEYKTVPEQFEGNTPVPDNSVPMQNESVPCYNGQIMQPPEWTKNIVIAPTPWDAPSENTYENPVNQPSDISYSAEQSPDGDEPEKNMPMILQLGIIALGILIVVLLFKYVTGINKNEPVSETSSTVTYSESTTVIPVIQTTDPVVTQPSSEAVASSSDEKENEKTTDKQSNKETEKTTDKQSDKASEKTTAKDKEEASSVPQFEDNKELAVKREVINYFNESVNRVKPEAVKIVKNFENRTHNKEKLELPGVIKTIAGKMLDDNLTNVVETVEYTTPEEIAVRFPVSGQNWSSQLTVDDVAEAVCTDMGNEYEITLKLYDTVDPEPGKGAAKAMECINVSEVSSTAPEFITSFSAEYYDCVIKCRADKATGRIIWANYTTPVVVKMGLDPGFTQPFDAQIGLTFERDYTIVY